jgi:hypothetical protein
MTPDEVTGRQELAVFLNELLAQVEGAPTAIPNSTLAEFLSGALGWIEDLDGYFLNRGEPVPDQPTWALVAAIFAAAAIYE